MTLTQENVHNSAPGQHSEAHEQGRRTPLFAYRVEWFRSGGLKTLFSPQLILKFTEGVKWFYCREKDPEGGEGSGCQFL